MTVRTPIDVSDINSTAAGHAVECALDSARVALLGQSPGDALAALDLMWDHAQHTEDGWYLRSGALIVLGLPGEGERVACEGVGVRPASTALRFIQSLARSALGDLAGARASLGAALQRLPSDPLLLVQQAVLQSRQGDDDAAEASLQIAARRLALDHPALAYGLGMVRSSITSRACEQPDGTERASPQLLNVVERTSVVPVRLGLRLIDETAGSRALARRAESNDARPTRRMYGPRALDHTNVPSFAHAGVARGLSSSARQEIDSAAVVALEVTVRPALYAIEGANPTSHGREIRIAAMLCVIIAAIAAVTGHTVIAVACGIGASWLALRRSVDGGNTHGERASERRR